MVEELSKNIEVPDKTKNDIVKFYEIALTGVIIDWIKNKMIENPKTLTDKLSRIIEGDIYRSLKKFEKKGLMNEPFNYSNPSNEVSLSNFFTKNSPGNGLFPYNVFVALIICLISYLLG